MQHARGVAWGAGGGLCCILEAIETFYQILIMQNGGEKSN